MKILIIIEYFDYGRYVDIKRLECATKDFTDHLKETRLYNMIHFYYDIEANEFLINTPNYNNKLLSRKVKSKNTFKKTLKEVIILALSVQKDKEIDLAHPHLVITSNLISHFVELVEKYNTEWMYLTGRYVTLRTKLPCEIQRNITIISKPLCNIVNKGDSFTVTLTIHHNSHNIPKILNQIIKVLNNKKKLYQDEDEVISKMRIELGLFKEENTVFRGIPHDLINVLLEEVSLHNISVKPYINRGYSNKLRLIVSRVAEHIKDLIRGHYLFSDISVEPPYKFYYGFELYKYNDAKILMFDNSSNYKQKLKKWIADCALIHVFFNTI